MQKIETSKQSDSTAGMTGAIERYLRHRYGVKEKLKKTVKSATFDTTPLHFDGIAVI